MNKVLYIDGHNFMHRARAGFNLGDVPVVFNFFRNFRAQVELHKPSRVYFVLEGHPKARYEMLPEYKANRRIEGDVSDPEVAKKVEELKNFFRQKDLIVDLLKRHFPVSVVRHADFECDDVIYNLVKRSSTAVPCVVVSNDSDFTQLLNEFNHVKLYNPMAKEFVSEPPFDYVVWKALRGDGSDNIPGLPGVGDKTADDLMTDPDRLRTLLEGDKALGEQFTRNYNLIKFHTWSDDEAMQMTCSEPVRDWDAVKSQFDQWLFKSMTKEGAWQKYTATFEPLWGLQS